MNILSEICNMLFGRLGLGLNPTSLIFVFIVMFNMLLSIISMIYIPENDI